MKLVFTQLSMSWNRVISLIAISFVFLFLSSCNPKYPDADLIVRYTLDNKEKFDDNNKFSIIVIRTPYLACGASMQKYDYEYVLEYSRKNFAPPIYILYDFDLVLYGLDSALYEGFHHIVESPFVLDSYAYPYIPTTFQIENKKIIKWKEFLE